MNSLLADNGVSAFELASASSFGGSRSSSLDLDGPSSLRSASSFDCVPTPRFNSVSSVKSKQAQVRDLFAKLSLQHQVGL